MLCKCGNAKCNFMNTGFLRAQKISWRARKLHASPHVTRERGLGNSEAQELAEQMDEKSKVLEMIGMGTDDVETG